MVIAQLSYVMPIQSGFKSPSPPHPGSDKVSSFLYDIAFQFVFHFLGFSMFLASCQSKYRWVNQGVILSPILFTAFINGTSTIFFHTMRINVNKTDYVLNPSHDFKHVVLRTEDVPLWSDNVTKLIFSFLWLYPGVEIMINILT